MLQSRSIQSLAMLRFRLWFMLLVLLTSVAAARAQNHLNVVASFSIVGDFAKNVGGERVSVTTLVGPDGDVHVYTPAPSDAQKIADAKLVIINGLGLEGWLSRLRRTSGCNGDIDPATHRIAPPQLDADADPAPPQSGRHDKVTGGNIH